MQGGSRLSQHTQSNMPRQDHTYTYLLWRPFQSLNCQRDVMIASRMLSPPKSVMAKQSTDRRTHKIWKVVRVCMYQSQRVKSGGNLPDLYPHWQEHAITSLMTRFEVPTHASGQSTRPAQQSTGPAQILHVPYLRNVN